MDKFTRTVAIELVNNYYKLKSREADFKNNFIETSYSIILEKEFIESIFWSIQILEDENEKNQWTKTRICEERYDLLCLEATRLYVTIRNYYILNNINHPYFTPKKNTFEDVYDTEVEDNECMICSTYYEKGNFYYSVSYGLNTPVCSKCVREQKKIYACETEETEASETASEEEACETASEIAEPAETDANNITDIQAYLKENDLIQCANCGNIWDGFAQCNCWIYSIYEEHVEAEHVEAEHVEAEHVEAEHVEARTPPNKPVPIPPVNKVLQDQVTGLQDQVTGLQDQVTGLHDQVTGLQDQVTGLQDQIIQLTERLIKLEK